MIHPRFVRAKLLEALEDTPIVYIHGPRQCGKSTLAKNVGDNLGYKYLTFDDPTLRATIDEDPVGFIADLPPRVILDEIQRVPDFFTVLKMAVDRDRTPGRFILTGSSNILQILKISDSLAGRMEVIRLHPLAQCEVVGEPSLIVDRMFQNTFKVQTATRLGVELAERIVGGGFPAALARTSKQRTSAWYREYAEALVQRDALEITRIRSTDALSRLLGAIAGQTARTFNISDLSSPFHVTRETISHYVSVLERLFLIDRVQPWHTNRLSRLVKTAKLHMVDTGLACALLGMNARALMNDRATYGQMTETFVYNELRRIAGWSTDSIRFYHFRDRASTEVDIVMERNSTEIVGVEVKVSASISAKDFNGLRKLEAASGSAFRCGVVFYDGETSVPFGDNMYAVPIQSLWR